MHEEERLFILKYIKSLKPKGETEKRIARRLVMKAMGIPVTGYPIYPPKDCPICDRLVCGNRYEQHVLICRSKREKEKQMPEIDPAVYEMLGGKI